MDIDSHQYMTHFARRTNAFLRLEEILSGGNYERINALLIGAGWDYAIRDRDLFGRFSWEPIEVALLLDRIGKPSALIVADKSEEVCEALRRQDELVLVDNISLVPEGRQYLDKVLQGLENVSEIDLKQYAEETGDRYLLHPSYGIRGIYRARIPEKIKQNMNIVQKSLSDQEQWESDYGKFNFVLCHQVILPSTLKMSSEEKKVAVRVLERFVASGGILSYASTEPIGFNVIEELESVSPDGRTTLYQNPIGYTRKPLIRPMLS